MPLALFSSRILKTHSSSRRSLRRAAGLGLGFLSLLSVSAAPASTSSAGTVYWDGTVADWFSNPVHWIGGNYPGATDDAVNSTTAAMTLGQSTTVNSFFSNGAFTLQGGTFSGNQANSASTITVNNVFTVDGGQINNFTVNQGKGGSLVFTGSGNNSITNSIINSSLDLATNTNAYLQTVGAVTENGNINLGTTSNGLEIDNQGSTLTLGGNGSLTGFGTVSQYQGTTLTNNGTVNANSAGNALNIGTSNFTNNGTAEATKGGTLALNNNITNSAGSTLAATGTGSLVSLTGTFTGIGNNSISATNGGQVQANGVNLLGTINEASGTALVFNGSGNNFLGDGTIVNGNLDLATDANAYLQTVGAVTENGNINLGTTSNGLQIDNGGSSLTLGSAGSLTGFGNVYQYQGTTLTNNGTVNANSAGNTLNLGISAFNNTGTAEATNGGTLLLNNTIANSGFVKADGAGSIVGISGAFTGTGDSTTNLITASGGGQVQANGVNLLGTINEASGTALVFNGSGNNLVNNGTPVGTTATINGNLDLATNANAYLETVGAVTENGTINLGTTSNGLQIVDGGSSLTLGSGGGLTGFGSVYQYQGTTLTNNGTINANSSSAPLNLQVSQFTNNGTAEATNGGTLNLNNSNTNANDGSKLAATGTGSVVSITGTYTGAGSDLITASNGGQVQVNRATLAGTINEASGTALVFNGSGNNFLGDGTTVNGSLDLATNANSYLQTVGAVTENGTIKLGTTSNGLQIVDGGSSLTLGSGGGLVGFGSVYQYQGTTLTNNGGVIANVAGQQLNLQVSTFNNNYIAEATLGGTLDFNNTNTYANNNSELVASNPGSVVSIAGTYTGAGNDLITTAGGGQVQVNGATLLGTINIDTYENTALVFNGSGNNVLGDGTTINGGSLDLATNTNAYLQTVGAVTENGTINLGTTSNGLQIVDGGSSLTLGTSGSLTGFGNVFQYQGTTLTNNGTVNANSAGNALNINTSAFNNTGTTEVQNGASLNVTSANTDSGNVLVKSGGTATFSQGVTQTAGLTQVDGTFNSPLTLTGGTLKGTGVINGNVDNSGGTVAAGDSPGTLTVNGTFTQAPGGTLNEQFTNAAASVLSVSNLVTTDGTLDVNYIDTAAYTGTGPFTFLDYGSLATTGTNALGLTQYFTNEVALTNDTGTILGHNGFTYELINNTGLDALQLQVLTPGTPQAVPEASTTISLGLLLSLGGVGLWRMKRRTVSAAD